jgi:hypothetical protein
MNWYLLAAAVLALTGLAHSVGGEIMIFPRMRAARTPYTGILWASWHLVTLLGASLCTVLVWLAQPHPPGLVPGYIAGSIAAATLAGAALVFYGTKGRHLGWLALLVVALFTSLA